MRAIAKLFRVNVSTVLARVRNFALENYEKPKPEGAVVLEPDEMRRYIEKKKQTPGLEGLLSRYRRACRHGLRRRRRENIEYNARQT
jgi:hypothetical protein